MAWSSTTTGQDALALSEQDLKGRTLFEIKIYTKDGGECKFKLTSFLLDVVKFKYDSEIIVEKESPTILSYQIKKKSNYLQFIALSQKVARFRMFIISNFF